MAIWYEPHPVSPERKDELRERGFRILDAAFAPADWINPDGIQAKETEAETQATVKPRGRPRKSD